MIDMMLRWCAQGCAHSAPARCAQSAPDVRPNCAQRARIVRAKFDAHTATATELLEAETLHNKAATDEIVSAFDYLVAVARLQNALGVAVDPYRGLAPERASAAQ